MKIILFLALVAPVCFELDSLLLWFYYFYLGPLLLLFVLNLRALVALVLYYVGPLLLLFVLNKSPCCSGFILFWALVTRVCFQLEPLLFWFYFIWGPSCSCLF